MQLLILWFSCPFIIAIISAITENADIINSHPSKELLQSMLRNCFTRPCGAWWRVRPSAFCSSWLYFLRGTPWGGVIEILARFLRFFYFYICAVRWHKGCEGCRIPPSFPGNLYSLDVCWNHPPHSPHKSSPSILAHLPPILLPATPNLSLLQPIYTPLVLAPAVLHGMLSRAQLQVKVHAVAL